MALNGTGSTSRVPIRTLQRCVVPTSRSSMAIGEQRPMDRAAGMPEGRLCSCECVRWTSRSELATMSLTERRQLLCCEISCRRARLFSAAVAPFAIGGPAAALVSCAMKLGSMFSTELAPAGARITGGSDQVAKPGGRVPDAYDASCVALAHASRMADALCSHGASGRGSTQTLALDCGAPTVQRPF